ncbi:MAG: ABC transporter ATP-binding protein, partial [Actinomycetota bacterium]
MIEVQGLTKRYGRTKAVDELSFTVRPGEVTGFLGPNGAGKSTTMRLILGLETAESGQALIDGVAYRDLPWPLRQVGSHLDARFFHPGMTAGQHLLAQARANAIDRRRVDQVLDLVGLTQVAGKRAGTFSLGMAQRLGIASALLGDPATLLFDEPMNGLDPEGIHWIRGLLRGLAAEGRAVLLSSHLIGEMALTADRLVVIGHGRMVSELSMADLTERAPERVRVRTADPERLVPILRGAGMSVATGSDGALAVTGGDAKGIAGQAFAASILLTELTPERATLEEVFFELTDASVEYRGAPRSGQGGPGPR